MSTADDTPGASSHGEEPRRAQLRAQVSGQGRVYQSARDQTIHHHYPPAPEPGQIVEGDIPQRPPGFQPREPLLRQLAELLGGPAPDHGVQDAGGGAAVICAVAGTPGVGKTMLAASYAWACQHARWPVVAWIAAETTDQILTGLAALAERLGERRFDEDAAASARRAKDWLAATTRPALLVFDNATDVNALRAWCPATGAARVVITTRNRAFARAYAPLDVEVFTAEQAEAFLRGRTRLDDPDGARALAHELGHLPLALAQAATVIVRLRLDYAGYLELLRGFPVGDYLTAHDGDAYPAGTAEAILLSVTQAESALPFAHELLPVLAVLSPSGVPLQVLSALGDAGSEAGRAPVRLREMLADLADTSLIAFSEDGTTVSMHRLIQRVLRDRAARHGDLGTVLDQSAALLQDHAASCRTARGRGRPAPRSRCSSSRATPSTGESPPTSSPRSSWCSGCGVAVLCTTWPSSPAPYSCWRPLSPTARGCWAPTTPIPWPAAPASPTPTARRVTWAGPSPCTRRRWPTVSGCWAPTTATPC
nr:NB-ARC domain-containing protein [Nonomuraea wenchangensis]